MPNLIILRLNVPKVSALVRQYSRFLEKRIGDWVRSHCVPGLLVTGSTRTQKVLLLTIISYFLLSKYSGTSGSMSGYGKRVIAEWPKPPRPTSTLPKPTCRPEGGDRHI